MKTPIAVKNRQEARAIRHGLTDPQTRALVITIGTLLALPSDRSRARVLSYVEDKFREEADATRQAATP